MHQSSLYYEKFAPEPKMTSLDLVRHALVRDAAEQVRKYGAAEANARTARFNVQLPKSPQHAKYSWNVSPRKKEICDEETEDWAGSGAQPPSAVRFNMQTLQSWFREIDQDGTGEISQRELICALRKKKDLKDMLCSMNGGARTAVDLKADIRRMIDVLKDVDTDGSCSLDWDEFVNFFRREGLLLEYKTRSEKNHTTLCAAFDEKKRAAIEEVGAIEEMA